MTDPTFEERRIVEAAKRNPDAFAALYDLYFDRVYAFAYRRLESRAGAEDVTAETFTRALANLAGFTWKKGGFGAWLFRIARNLCADQGRAARVSVPLPSDDTLEDEAPGQPDVEETAEEAELVSRLRLLVAGLPDPQREVILLKFAAGLDNRQIAVATGRTPTAVSSLVFRVTERLRKELEAGHA